MTLTYIDDDDVERLAIKLAEANNGGKWATHYQEQQKDVWRKRAQDWIEEVVAAVHLDECHVCPACNYG